MTDRYADLRAALDAGPASGEWISRKDGRFMNMDGWSAGHKDHTFSAAAPIKAGGEVIAIVVDGRDEFNQEMAKLKANADYIAAAHPETIRTLLADYDRMRDALETIAVYPHARDQEMSTAAMRKIARAALAQKQGGSDDNRD